MHGILAKENRESIKLVTFHFYSMSHSVFVKVLYFERKYVMFYTKISDNHAE